MDRIDRYQIFMQVAELGSFIGAAKALGLPRATVSAAIQQLESSLGTRLFHRTTRQTQLTADGIQLLEHIRPIVSDVEELEAQFRDRRSRVSGRLSIDAPSRIVRRLLMPQLDQFLARHPQLEVFLGSTDRFVDLVQEGIDCAIRVGELENSSLVVRPLGKLALINCASPAYLQAHGDPEHPDHLAPLHRIVGYSITSASRAAEWDYVTTHGVPLSVNAPATVTVNNAENYIAACLAGLGLIQVPRFDVQHLLDEGRLVEVMPDRRPAPMPLSLVYPHRRQRTARVLAFSDWFSELVAPHLLADDRGV